MNSEHIEQRNLVQWFRRRYPGVRIFAIPNGGTRSRSQGAKLKMEGVSPGVPDLFIPAWNLWIEMKREKGGHLSAPQKDWKKYIESIGGGFILGNGFEDAKAKIIELRG